MTVEVVQLTEDSNGRPFKSLQFLNGECCAVSIIGDAAILRLNMTAIFCSIKCPGDLILKTYDLARALRDAGVPVIGGFHSPMEKECLDLLLRGRQPIVAAMARGLDGMRLPRAWSGPIEEGRLLLISSLSGRLRRTTKETAEQRNRLVAALAKQVVVTHAGIGGRLEQLCREITGEKKRLWTFDHPENAHLLTLKARSGDVDDLVAKLGGGGQGRNRSR